MTHRKIAPLLLAGLLTATLASAQPRACLDVDADGVVTSDDVALAAGAASGLNAAVDPRADFDLVGGVTVADSVNLQRVADGTQLGLLGFEKVAVKCGDQAYAIVQNQKLAESNSVKVTVDNGTSQVTVTGSLRNGIVSFRMPDVEEPDLSQRAGIDQALPAADLKGLVLVSVSSGQQVSNACFARIVPKDDRDTDGDGIPNDEDLCPFHVDPQNADTDLDGLGDLCDNCPATPNVDQVDSNGDGSGDACAPPAFAIVNGQLVEPEPGVDPAIEEIPSENPHVVLVMTRELSMEIETEILDLGVRIVQRLARHAFVVSADKATLAGLANFLWFKALFPLDAGIRLVDELENDPPKDPLVSLSVTFHSDVELDLVQALLEELGAKVLSQGVELAEPTGTVRYNTWQVEVDNGTIDVLAGLDEVMTVDLTYQNTTQNATSRAAINVNVINAGGLNGNGMNVGEWDQGWADGDNVGLPGLPPGGVHPALAPRVMVRDHGLGFEGFPPPTGCSTNITCNALCGYGHHATHVSGTMIGDGALVGGGTGPNRGMANLGTLRGYEWPDNVAEMVCERTDAMSNFGTVAHNNSWGYVAQCNLTMGAYLALTAAYDQNIRANPFTAELFAAANDQDYRNMNPCALPPIYNAPTCATPPPGVTPPAIIPIPPPNTVNRFYTVESPGGTAKSVVTVGNMDFPNNRLNNSSSMGPTQDGRLKPEVVAHGTSVASTCVPFFGGCVAPAYVSFTGTSMATPATTGATSLLYEHGQNLGTPLTSDSARALLAHTATDLDVHPVGSFLTVTAGQWQSFGTGADGPDFLTGYGLVNAQAARDHMTSGNLSGTLKPSGCPTGVNYPSIPFNSPVAVGGAGPVAGCPPMIWDVVWYVTVPSGLTELKVTIAWNDVQATPGANPTLVNDIDLMAIEPGGLIHYPWWLDPSCPHRQAARVQSFSFNNATYGDHVNTIEQVHVVGGVTPGQWRIIVRSPGLAAGPQPFSMMISAF